MINTFQPRIVTAALLAIASLAACMGEPHHSLDTIQKNAPAAAAAPAAASAADSAPAPAAKTDAKPAAKAAAATGAAAAAAPASAPAPAPAPPAAMAPAMAPAAAAAHPPAAHAAAGVKPNALVIHGNAAMINAPSTVPAGLTNITLVNDGPGLQHIQLVKLETGKTAADFAQAMKENSKFPRWALLASGPNAVQPGNSSSATVDLSAGDYVIVGVKKFPEHAPYIEKGSLHPLTVTANSAPQATMPTPDVTLTVNEYSIALSGPVAAGPRVFEVKVAGQQAHEAVLFKLRSGKTEKDFKTWAEAYEGTMPANVIGGVGGTEPGIPVQFSVILTPGTYVLASFTLNGTDQKPDIERGMMTTFTVQ